LIHIPSGREQLDEWLEPTLKMMAFETRHLRPGSETPVARLIDMILARAVRVWLDEQPRDGGGWLGALRDPQIGAALGLIHRDPQRNWSIDALAHEVAMSRSVFAAKLSSLVGMSPHTYLRRWRLWHASRLLAEGNGQVKLPKASRIGKYINFYDPAALDGKPHNRKRLSMKVEGYDSRSAIHDCDACRPSELRESDSLLLHDSRTADLY
jgi:AraC-like DNA-binding protein